MNSDLIELLRILDRKSVKFLIVGGYALAEYVEPRFTKDIDIVVATDSRNVHELIEALREFGAPVSTLSPESFQRPDHFYQLGFPPNRVDILTSIPGIEFEEAYPRRKTSEVFGVRASFLSAADLLASKIASGRPQDLLDAELLTKYLASDSG